MPINEIGNYHRQLNKQNREDFQAKYPDKFQQIGSSERKLAEHWQKFLDEKDLHSRIAIVRSMLKIPGGRGFARAKSLEVAKLVPGHKKNFSALIGDYEAFQSSRDAQEVKGETLLGLACEGGNPKIIQSIEGYPEKLFENLGFFSKALVKRLTPDVVTQLRKDSKFANLWAEYQKPGFLKRLGSGLLSVLGAPIRGGRRLIANIAQAWERRKRMGSVSVEGEQRMAMPIPGVDRNYEAKMALYKAFQGDEKTVLANLLVVSKESYLVDYLCSNTFHFLGGLIQRGDFKAAKKMIEKGYYNEASPRLFMMMNLSSMTIEQQFELLNLMLDKAKDLDQQVLITRHMLTMPGGREAIKSTKPAVKALRGLELDQEEFNRLILNRTKNGQRLLHWMCEGGNSKNIRDLSVGVTLSSALKSEDKNGNRPIDFMTLETANKLDALYNQDPNKKGSFSMAVMHSIYVRTPMRWQEFVPGTLGGKFSGALGVSAMLPLIDQVAAMGGASAVGHVGAAIAESAMLNAPVYGGVLTGAKITSWFGRRIWKANKAADLGLDDTLIYNPKIKPELEPNYFPAMDMQERANWLNVSCARAMPETSNPDDGIKAVEFLLESQLELGGVGTREAIAQAIRMHLSRSFSIAHLRSYFLTAVRMADFHLMQEIQDKFPDPTDALWLDTFVRQDLPHDRGNTVMHVACQTGNVAFIKQVAEEMQKQMQARMKRAGAQGFTHTLPETTKVTAFSRAATFVESSGGRWKSQLPWDFNPFSMSNSYGQTPAELLPVAVARKLDEDFKLDPEQPGSFMQIARDRLEAQEMILGAQVSCAIPAKIVMNIKLAHTVGALVLAGKGIGAAHGGPVGAVLGGAITDFALGTGIAITGFAIGAITGEGYAKSLKSMQDSLRGYGNEMTQLTDTGLQIAKKGLGEYCNKLSLQAESVFVRKISRPEELVDLLTELATRDKEFAEKFGKAIAAQVPKA